MRGIRVFALVRCLLAVWLVVLCHPTFAQEDATVDRLELRVASVLTSQGDREVTLPDAWNKAGRSGQKVYRLGFMLQVVPEEAWSVYIPRAGNRFLVSLNGRTVYRAGPLGDAHADYAQKPQFFSLPEGLLQAGQNHLDILVEGDLNRYAGLSRVHIGADRLLRRDFQVRNAAQHGGSLAVVAMCGVFGLFALALFVSLRQSGDAFFALACLFCCIRTSYAIVERVPIDYRWWTWLIDVSYAGLVVCIALFCVRALKMAGRHWDVLAGAFMLLSLVLVSWHAGALRNDVRQVWLMTMLAFVTLMSLALLYEWWRQRSSTSAVLALAAMGGLSLGARDHWVVFYSSDGYGGFAMARFALVLFILAMGWIIVDRLISRMRDERRFRDSMGHELESRRKELARHYQQQAAMDAMAARNRERQRLIQDLHDGMGLQLNSLLGMVEKGAVNPIEVKNEVRHSIEQLRTLVDGSEAFDGSLLELLGHIRHRIETRLRRQQMSLDWHSELLAGPAQVDAVAAVNLQYILFELCTNAIKHSGAARVSICCSQIEDPQCGSSLEIDFVDNGHASPEASFDASTGGGLGRRSVERRVKELNGYCELHRVQGNGWRYRLVVPLAAMESLTGPAPAQASHPFG
ncbi:MAG: hypothetical protein R3E94_03675 [Burkholderiaceae bacterium]